MSGLAELAFRLARAGGARRTVVIMVGAGIVTFLVLAALAIPDAIFEPGSYAETTERAGITMLLSFILVPAVILLLTVSRTSAAIRDRRLASLRMLGLSRRRTALLAGLENGSLTLAGALIGAALFVGLAPVIDRAVAAGPGWFLQPFEASPATTALTVALVTLLAAGLAMSSLSRVARSPLSQRSEAARKEPHALRLLALGVAFTCLLVLRAPQDQLRAWNQDLVVGLLLGGLMAGAVGVALVTPLIAAWAARLFVGSGRPAAVLAGRALQVEPGGTGRLVAGIGVAVYLLVIALGVVAGFESTAQYRSNLQALTTGPQLLWMNQTEGELARDPDVERAIEAVPGVHAAIPRYNAAPAGCEETGPDSPEVCFVHPFVGTCAQLGHLMEVSGCRDDSAGAILVENHHGTATGWEVYPPGLETLRTLSLQFTSGELVEVELGAPLTQDSAATQERWLFQSTFTLFVPVQYAESAGARPQGYHVVADGGFEVRDSLESTFANQFAVAPPYLDDYHQVQRVRTVVFALAAVAISVGFLTFAMAATDRAVSNRRAVARHLAVGMPLRTLAAAQFLQSLSPCWSRSASPCWWGAWPSGRGPTSQTSPRSWRACRS